MKFIIGIALAFAASASAQEMALVQYNADLHFGEYDYNLRKLKEFADQAVAQGSKIIVFPEGSHYGYADKSHYWCRPDILGTDSMCVDVRLAAEKIPGGRTSEYWASYAILNMQFVLINLPESDSGAFFNTTAVFGPGGYVTKYRKRALYTTDQFYAEPGNLGPVTFQTPYGEFGILICMDADSPESFDEYSEMGVSRVIVPMDWDEDPNGAGGGRPARLYFQMMAAAVHSNIFVSDVSAWDGTGLYRFSGKVRERNGLPSIAIGQDGISFHALP